MAVTPLASPEWHRSAHLELRRQIMGRLRDHPILAVNPALQRDAARHGMPTLLQRLEWMLYHAAHSINEYANVDTLERRVQALVTHYTRHQPDQEATSGEDSDESSSDSSSVIQRPMTGRTRRFQSMTGDPEELRAGKRQHTLKALDSIDSDQEVELTCTDRVDGRRHSCALSHNLDLLRHVFSFLDGRESLRCRAVNRFFRVYAPSFVWTLTIESVGPAGIRCSDDAVGLADLLVNCKNIRRVMISSSINQTNIKAGVVFPRALSQATAQAPASFGRQAVLELADAVSRGGCRKLEAVHLAAPFDYANESDAVLTLIHALTTGSIDSAATGRASGSMRKRRRRASLKALVLDSTFLGDKGIVKLAKTIESVPHFFHKVEQLGLRNNFIGEGGCCAMLDAIAVTMPKLRALDLRQNILTNVDAVEIADLLDRPAPGVKCEMELDTSLPIEQLAVPRLSEIELDGNFISCDGFHAISIAMCSHGEAPAGLIRSISGEEGESDDSSRSSYAEPMED